MWWFKSRPKQSRTVRQELRLAVVQLESREAAGNVWLPASAIDISGLNWNSRIFVAGDVVEIAISGSGEDWDVSMNEFSQYSQSVQDTVSITWSGAPCQVLDAGRRALCTLGSPGAPGIFNITMFADDDAVTQPGDTGTRNDDAVIYTEGLTAIWVSIGANSQGPMDDDDQGQLSFPHSPPPRQLGGTQTTIDGFGLYLKVELTGTVIPAVPNGTGPFDWWQKADVRTCYHKPNGEVAGFGFLNDEDIESPLGSNQTKSTFNSKVFMKDNPGWPFGRLAPANTYDKVITYWNFTTWIKLNNTRASYDYEWHISMGIGSDGQFWGPDLSWLSPANPGHDFVNAPPQITPPDENGDFNVDCLGQTW